MFYKHTYQHKSSPPHTYYQYCNGMRCGGPRGHHIRCYNQKNKKAKKEKKKEKEKKKTKKPHTKSTDG